MRTISYSVIFTLTACTSSSKTEEFCERADHCNTLNGSVEECVERLDKDLDKLAPTDRDELLLAVQKCLDHPSCDAFKSCINTLASGSGVTFAPVE
jgi:hypothetical protein